MSRKQHLGKPSKYLLFFCHENTPILNHIGHNFQCVLAVGVEEEYSGTSIGMLPVYCCFDFAALMLPTYAIMENWPGSQ